MANAMNGALCACAPSEPNKRRRSTRRGPCTRDVRSVSAQTQPMHRTIFTVLKESTRTNVIFCHKRATTVTINTPAYTRDDQITLRANFLGGEGGGGGESCTAGGYPAVCHAAGACLRAFSASRDASISSSAAQ